jgi:hypothetical protein
VANWRGMYHRHVSKWKITKTKKKKKKKEKKRRMASLKREVRFVKPREGGRGKKKPSHFPEPHQKYFVTKAQ